MPATIRKPIIAITAVVALLSASLPAAQQVHAATATQQQQQWIQQVNYNGNERGLSYPLIVEPGRVWIGMDDAASLLIEYRREYDAKKGTIAFTNPWRHIEMKLGSKAATVNGTKVTLAAAPAKRDGTVYLPAQLLSQLMKAQLKWTARTSTLSVQYNARALATSWGDDYFWIDKTNGDLYKAAAGQRAVRIGRTTADISHARYLELEPLDESNKFLIKALDRYAEPTYITKLILNGDKLVHQAAVHYSNWIWLEGLERYNDQLIMINGSTVEFVTTTGQVSVQYNLADYGVTDEFVVEDYFNDVLFIRSYSKRTLLLVDLKEKKTYELYKLMLDANELKIMNDAIAYSNGYPGDKLTALGRRGDTFTFSHEQLIEPFEETQLEFTIPREK